MTDAVLRMVSASEIGPMASRQMMMATMNATTAPSSSTPSDPATACLPASGLTTCTWPAVFKPSPTSCVHVFSAAQACERGKTAGRWLCSRAATRRMSRAAAVLRLRLPAWCCELKKRDAGRCPRLVAAHQGGGILNLCAASRQICLSVCLTHLGASITAPCTKQRPPALISYLGSQRTRSPLYSL